jgi:hypothetical protein
VTAGITEPFQYPDLLGRIAAVFAHSSWDR